VTIVKCQYSLRARIGKIVLIFSILLASFYTTMLAMLYDWGLADATHGLVLQEAELFKQSFVKNPNTPLPNTRSIKGFIGEANLPTEIIDIFPRQKWNERPKDSEKLFYRFEKLPGMEAHHHLLITSLPNTHDQLFIYYKIATSDEIASKVWRKFKLLAIIGGILVITMLLVFKTTIARSLTPLTSLSKWIDALDQKNPPDELPKDIRPDEIGQMAKSLHIALQRIHEYNERERQFLRNASHELRTPIAIIRNALDVLEHKRKIGNDDIDRIIQRIRRAGDTMKSVTEAILWLAIENYSAPTKKPVNLTQLTTNIVEENKNLYDSKQVTVVLENDRLEKDLHIEAALAYIVLDNLIRNAFQHSSNAEITLTALSPTRISITNTNHSYSYDSTTQKDAVQALATGNFGLGLTLVQKITEKQGWEFSFTLDKQLARAVLDFRCSNLTDAS